MKGLNNPHCGKEYADLALGYDVAVSALPNTYRQVVIALIAARLSISFSNVFPVMQIHSERSVAALNRALVGRFSEDPSDLSRAWSEMGDELGDRDGRPSYVGFVRFFEFALMEIADSTLRGAAEQFAVPAIEHYVSDTLSYETPAARGLADEWLYNERRFFWGILEPMAADAHNESITPYEMYNKLTASNWNPAPIFAIRSGPDGHGPSS